MLLLAVHQKLKLYEQLEAWEVNKSISWLQL